MSADKAVFTRMGKKSATKRHSTATEHQEQVALIRWFDLQFPALRGRLAAIPNGGHRNKIVAAKLKAEGVRAGYLDLQLLTPRQGYHGLIIEMKRVKKWSLSPEQADWLEWLNAQGYLAVICKGFEEARAVITDYLVFRASGETA